MHESSPPRARSLLKSPLVLAALAIGLCACSPHFVANIEPPASTAPGSLPPDSRALAKIVEIRDLRRFEAAPRDPSAPSLADASMLSDASLTARAVGRLRDAYGAARGDVLLPEGRTVVDLMRAVATKAIESNGYRVVDQTSPQYAAAAPLAVDIEQFWEWNSPSGLMEFKAIVTMKSAELIGKDAATADGYARASATFVLTNSDRLDLFQRGMSDLAQNMSAEIKTRAAAKVSSN
jgi:hypothetical protein